MRAALPLAAAALALGFPGAGIAKEPGVRIVLKFVKTKAVSGPVAALDPASCEACTDQADPEFARDNVRETLLDLRLPRDRQLELAFAARLGSVARVVLENTDLPFRWEGGRLLVEVPPLRADLIHAGEFATHIVEPGMVMRVEHADPARLAGDYAGKPLPAIERRAIDHIEFSLRETIRRLDLGDRVARQGLGVIEVMGFDTNNPHGHRDSPPHFHMHLRRPYNVGTQIGHLYVGADGLIRDNVVGLSGYRLPDTTFARGAPVTTSSHKGTPVYTLTITHDGGLDVATAWSDAPVRTCRIRAAGEGFHRGAIVACDGDAPVPIAVQDDPAQGMLRVRTGAVRETFRYDRQTGLLLSPTEQPPLPADAVVPVSQAYIPLPAAAAPTEDGDR